MRTAILVVLILASVTLQAAPARTSVDVAGLKKAANAGLAIVQKAASNYPKHRDCFSCHHQTLPMLAMSLSHSKGLAIDQALLQSQAEFSWKTFDERREKVSQGKGVGGASMTVAYGLWALDIATWPADETTTAMVDYLLKKQRADGSWLRSSNRPPLEESNFTCSILAVHYMRKYAPEDRKADVEKAALRAKDWVLSTSPKSHEDLVSRLGALALLGADKEAITATREKILVAQRKDGGWSQLPDMESDAYATGMTLYTLQRTRLPTSDERYQRGLKFLLTTQYDDGSWFVKSRSRPIQKLFDNGDPHGTDQFISIAATSWATAALVLALPDTNAEGNAANNYKVADKPTWPGVDWQGASPASLGLRRSELAKAKAYALSEGGSGMIVRHGKAAMRWGDQKKRYDIKSASKSVGATALGLAIMDGKLSLDDKAVDRHPTFGIPPETNKNKDWLSEITLRHLATQTAGFAKPGGYEKLLFRPGSQWHYSDGGPNWLAECVTLAYRTDIEELLFERVFSPIGIERDDLRWRKHQYRDHDLNGIPRREFGSGIHANVNALARIGYLYLRKGQWNDKKILSADYIKQATGTFDSVVGLEEHEDDHGNASDHYGLLWWNNADGTLPRVPKDAYWAWGLYDSLIVVIPSLDLVIVRTGARGKSWPRKKGENHYDVLKPFLDPIALATRKKAADEDKAPYARSAVIRGVKWDPKSKIIRKACGGDNWPITWGDDDLLYTAYGDGKGFKPKVEKKLSLGLAMVEGGPTVFIGRNLRSNIEEVGDGNKGRKASGLLMVDGKLYMFARNAKNSQLAVSADRGKEWTWADWKFETSFGCPTFLNFGKNYSGATDDFVYVYTFDSDSAYEPADRMVMARVPKDRIQDRTAYEFFVRLDAATGNPIWTDDINKRGTPFKHKGRCYRSGITYNAGLKRFLWVQIIPDMDGKKADTRFEGGFAIYDAPNPWGPWTTAWYTDRWDVGPGETASLPTKWMSEDGRTVHLVFSGDDCFSIRRAVLEVE